MILVGILLSAVAIVAGIVGLVFGFGDGRPPLALAGVVLAAAGVIGIVILKVDECLAEGGIPDRHDDGVSCYTEGRR